MKTIAKALLLMVLILSISSFFLVKPDVSFAFLRDQYTNNSSQFVEVHGMNIHYRVQGKGDQVLLLLHGTGASLHTWEGWVSVMQDSFTVVTLDLPAFGLTGPHPDGDYSMEAYVAFLDEFIDKIKLDRFSICGNSLGGGIAWNYAATYPERVEGMVLIDASGYPTVNQIGIFQLAKNPIIAPMIKYITPRKLIAKNLMEVYADDSKVTEKLVDRYFYLARRAGNRQAFIDRARTIMDYNTSLIQTINIPTLIMWGAEDKWTDASHAEIFSENLPIDTVIIYEDLGHVPMEEDPIRTARDASHFLRKLSQNLSL